MDNAINGRIRPCVYFTGGEKYPCLFHRWVTLCKDYRGIRKGTLVALVEWEDGSMDYKEPDYIFFTDTKKLMEQLGFCVDPQADT